VGQFLISTSVSIVTVLVLVLYEGKLKVLDIHLKERMINQSPLAFRSSVHVEPYGAGPYHVVTFNYAFHNVGGEPISIKQVIVRTFLHKAIPLADKPLAVETPGLDDAGCVESQDAWLEYARPKTYARQSGRIKVGDGYFTPAQYGGGLAELEPKDVSSGKAEYIVKTDERDFLGFVVCVEHQQIRGNRTEEVKSRPWRNAIAFPARNIDWTYESVKE
jgi:hypothetical protein